MSRPVKVEPKIAAPENQETLAEAIRKISEAATRLANSGMKREAVVILIHHKTGLSQRDVTFVLDTLANLSRRFTQ